MTPCAGNTSKCNLTDIRPVKLLLRRELVLWCSGCRAAADAMGLQVVERRTSAVPVASERRSFRPPWLDRLTARDETRRSA